jgi:hypothetical protein
MCEWVPTMQIMQFGMDDAFHIDEGINEEGDIPIDQREWINVCDGSMYVNWRRQVAMKVAGIQEFKDNRKDSHAT